MKIIITEKKTKKIVYPWFGIHSRSEEVILFTSPQEGYTFSDGLNFLTGMNEILFRPFYGTIEVVEP